MSIERGLKPGKDKQERLRAGVSRRTFLVAGAAAGGGLLLGFYLPQRIIAEAAMAGADVFGPNAFVRIRPDDSVTLVMPQVEMGQGTYTSMSMLIAEELEVDLVKVTLQAAPPDDRLYANPLIGFQVTGGSTSVMAMWEPLRRAGATARVMLIAAAAAGWNVDPMSCRAEKGTVFHPPTGQRLNYGALADAAAKLPVPDKVVLNLSGVSRRLAGAARRTFSTTSIGPITKTGWLPASTRKGFLSLGLIASPAPRFWRGGPLQPS
jgi:isoquinoline 1-oxidoreductase subunit beta